MHFKTDKFNVAKRTISKYSHLKWTKEDQPNGAICTLLLFVLETNVELLQHAL